VINSSEGITIAASPQRGPKGGHRGPESSDHAGWESESEDSYLSPQDLLAIDLEDRLVSSKRSKSYKASGVGHRRRHRAGPSNRRKKMEAAAAAAAVKKQKAEKNAVNKAADKTRTECRGAKAAINEANLGEVVINEPTTTAAPATFSHGPVNVVPAKKCSTSKEVTDTVGVATFDTLVQVQPALPSLLPIPESDNKFAVLAELEQPSEGSAPDAKDGLFRRCVNFAGRILRGIKAGVHAAVAVVKGAVGRICRHG